MYQRTGIIHVLVISGSHLILLAWVWLWLLPRLGFRQRQAVIFVAVFLILYVSITGVRPPSVRSAVTMMAAFTPAWSWRRCLVPANVFALAWIFVLALNPTNAFDPGCQLSFLCVLVLYRIGKLWEQQDQLAPDKQDPNALSRRIDPTRPWWLRRLHWLGAGIGQSYLVSVLLWLAVTPLAASYYHNVAPVAILLGPPVAFLTGIALAFGFLVLLAGTVETSLCFLPALPVKWSLAACQYLIGIADRCPGSHFTVPDLPFWWVAVFYLGLLACLTVRSLRSVLAK